MKRCRFCRKTGEPLTFQPGEDDYRPGRRGYKAQGFGPSYYHEACLVEFVAFDNASKARAAAEFAEQVAEIRRQIDGVTVT